MVSCNCKGGNCGSHVIRWWLASDGNMDYSVFRGTEPPRLDRVSGRLRWYGNDRCQMVMTSIGSPEIISDIFGITLDASQCVEIDPLAMRLAPLKMYDPGYQMLPADVQQTQQASYMQQSQPVHQGAGGSLNIIGPEEKTAVPIGRLAVGEWFKMHDLNARQDWPGCVLDQGLIVLYTDQGPALLNMSGNEPCTPVEATLSWKRKQFPTGDAMLN